MHVWFREWTTHEGPWCTRGRRRRRRRIDVLVHEGRARGDLSEEGDLDGLANLDALALLHKDLARVLAAVLAVERGHAVLLGVVPSLNGWRVAMR